MTGVESEIITGVAAAPLRPRSKRYYLCRVDSQPAWYDPLPKWTGAGMKTLSGARIFHATVFALILSGCGSRTCEYTAIHPYETLPRFVYTVTLQEGSGQSCSTPSTIDGGFSRSGWSLGGEISGRVSEFDGTAFSLDICAEGTGCSPTQYRFSFDAPDLVLDLPLGRQVTVTWQIAFGWGGTKGLVVHDGSPSDFAAGTSPAIWLAGADSNLDPPSTVPFSVAHLRHGGWKLP